MNYYNQIKENLNKNGGYIPGIRQKIVQKTEIKLRYIFK